MNKKDIKVGDLLKSKVNNLVEAYKVVGIEKRGINVRAMERNENGDLVQINYSEPHLGIYRNVAISSFKRYKQRK